VSTARLQPRSSSRALHCGAVRAWPCLCFGYRLRSAQIYIVYQMWVALRIANRITPNLSLAEKEFTNAAVNIAGSLVSFFYFRWSVRVKRTYGRNL
jgi:hypothetical protein